MSMTLMNINPQKKNFPPLRFSCLYDLKVSGPEIRHLPANHPAVVPVLPTSEESLITYRNFNIP